MTAKSAWVYREKQPYQPGNLEALKHGARSERMILPLIEIVEAHIIEAAPWTDREAFAEARRSLARTEAQLLLLEAWLDEQGILRMPGPDELEPQPRAALNLMHQLENRADKLRDKLGLTPQSLAKLLASLTSVATASGDSDALAALQEEGRKMLAAREEQIA